MEDTAFSDYLICIGTSLEVYPFAGIADFVPKDSPRLLINRNRVGTFGSREGDQVVQGDLIQTIQALADAMGWAKELRGMADAAETS